MKTEIDAKDRNSPKARPNSLDAMWGRKMAKYSTDSEEEYIKMLKKMNKADLQAECLRIHEIPHDERARMEDKLLKQFRRYNNSTKNSELQAKTFTDTDKTEAARRMLANMLGTPMSSY